MKEFHKHHAIVAHLKQWFNQKQFVHVNMREKINFVGNPPDKSFVRTELILTSSLKNFPKTELWITNEGAIGLGLSHPTDPDKFICGHGPIHISIEMVLILLEILASGACALKKSWFSFLGFERYLLLVVADDLEKIKHYEYSLDYGYATNYISPCRELPEGKNILELVQWS